MVVGIRVKHSEPIPERLQGNIQPHRLFAGSGCAFVRNRCEDATVLLDQSFRDLASDRTGEENDSRANRFTYAEQDTINKECQSTSGEGHRLVLRVVRHGQLV